MNDERLDLRALDPTRDPERFERAVGRIMDRAALPLAARRARLTAVGQVTRWWRPMLAVAAALAIVALGVLTRVDPAAATEPGVAEAIGIPTTVATWMVTAETPTAAQVYTAFEEEP
jgi:anti-sigma-K factor RskA